MYRFILNAQSKEKVPVIPVNTALSNMRHCPNLGVLLRADKVLPAIFVGVFVEAFVAKRTLARSFVEVLALLQPKVFLNTKKYFCKQASLKMPRHFYG
jgi:hypothetical protein